MITRGSFYRVTLFLAAFYVLAIRNDARSQNHDVQSWNAFVTDWNFRQSMLVELELDYNRLLSEGPVWREYAMQPTTLRIALICLPEFI